MYVKAIATAGKHFSNTNLSDLSIVGTNHVIHLIGRFKRVINQRYQASLKPLF